MQAFILNLLFNAVRLMTRWLFKMLRPVLRALFNLLWPVIRVVMIVVGLVAGIFVLRRLIVRRSRRLRAA